MVNKFNMRSKLLLLIVFAQVLVGCASGGGEFGTGRPLSGALAQVEQKKTNRNSSNTTVHKANYLALVSKFPVTEVPHTLLRKPLAKGRLTSGYGYRLTPTGIPLPRNHKGVDYAAETGTAIFAAGSGTIEKLYTSKSYGNYIRIKHDNGFSTAYAHMNSFTDGLKTGSEVYKGQVIGTVGSTGKSSSPHLHFELLYGNQFLDPLFQYTNDADVAAP